VSEIIEGSRSRRAHLIEITPNLKLQKILS
jgi:hypothetical protein